MTTTPQGFPTGLPQEHRRYLDELERIVRSHIALAGCYVHGSAALGGYVPGVSDLDVLVVSRGRPSDRALRELGRHLLGLPCPAAGLELSVVTDEAARHSPESCEFVLHVDSVDQRAVIGGREPDPDLVLHYAVCLRSAVPLGGSPPASDLIAPVPVALVRRQLVAELQWAIEHAPAHYLVLNACRALRFTGTTELVSKSDGARWALDHDIEPGLVRAAQRLQAGGTKATEISPADATRLARRVIRELLDAHD